MVLEKKIFKFPLFLYYLPLKKESPSFNKIECPLSMNRETSVVQIDRSGEVLSEKGESLRQQ